MRPQEISWMFGGGAAALKPLGWTRFLQPLSPQERLNPLAAYYKRLLSPDAKVRSEAVSGFMRSWVVGWVHVMEGLA
jgi:proline iminopeptidase